MSQSLGQGRSAGIPENGVSEIGTIGLQQVKWLFRYLGLMLLTPRLCAFAHIQPCNLVAKPTLRIPCLVVCRMEVLLMSWS